MRTRNVSLGLGAALLFGMGFATGWLVRGEHGSANFGGASANAAGGTSDSSVSDPSEGLPDGSADADGGGGAALAAAANGDPVDRGEGDVAVVGAEGAAAPSSAAAGSSTAGPPADGGPAPSGRLDAQAIRDVMHEHLDEFGFCFAWQLHQHPELRGRVTMGFTIGADGRVTQPEVLEDGLGDETVLRCFVGVTQRMEFPPPENGELSVRYPLVLTPEDEDEGE